MSRSPAPGRAPSPRRRSAALLALTLATVVAAGCSYRSPPVPVTGSRTALDALAGEWTGEYSSGSTGRSGSIHFVLHAASDSAFGEVVMVPAGATAPLVRAPDAGRIAADPTARPTPTEVLTIRFVRAEGDRIAGSLDPYRAPDCQCILTTTFTGQQRGDTITGTFVTTGDPTRERQTGRWQVTRRPR
ncbi:MAG TPA: hypothetical protein VFS08_12065 [Gemmatimonadaceae bacterium]|nr:hypothetical protein [Gemmatimonadaceae bacterium]